MHALGKRSSGVCLKPEAFPAARAVREPAREWRCWSPSRAPRAAPKLTSSAARGILHAWCAFILQVTLISRTTQCAEAPLKTWRQSQRPQVSPVYLYLIPERLWMGGFAVNIHASALGHLQL